MEEIKKEGWVIGVMALLFAVINRINQNAEINRVFIFDKPEMHWKYYAVTVIALAVSVLLFAFLIWIVFELGRWHHPNCVEFIRYFLVYFVIQLMILFCIWPGNFKQDEFYLVLGAIDNMQVYWIQSFFTQMHYTISLMIFPYLASIVFFQICIISVLAALVMQKAAGILTGKRFAWILLVPFLLLPILDSNQFPLRSSVICWIFLLIVVWLYAEFRKNRYISAKCKYLLVFLAVFIGVWRTEFLYLLPLLILLMIILQKQNRLKNFIKMLIFSMISYCILTVPNRFFQPDTNYILTSVLTPLSEIMVSYQYDWEPSLEKEFKLWNDYLPVEELQEVADLGLNTPKILYDKPILSGEEKLQYMQAALKILAYYRGDFIENRFRIYCLTNGFVPNIHNHGKVNKETYDGQDLYNKHFRFTQAANWRLKYAIIAVLGCRRPDNYLITTFLYPVLYNSTWGIILMLVFGIVFLFRKEFFRALICGIILCQLIPIFLAAPSYFFMYYMPFYLTSYTMVTLFIIEWLDKRYAKKHSDKVTDEDIKADISEKTEEQHAAD